MALDATPVTFASLDPFLEGRKLSPVPGTSQCSGKVLLGTDAFRGQELGIRRRDSRNSKGILDTREKAGSLAEFLVPKSFSTTLEIVCFKIAECVIDDRNDVDGVRTPNRAVAFAVQIWEKAGWGAAAKAMKIC